MSLRITTQHAMLLNQQADRGDIQELERVLNHLAQLEGPRGMDRADILLLAKNTAGDNIVHIACASGNTEIITFVCGLNEFALKPGVMRSIMNARNNLGDTPIHVATKSDQQTCADAVLQHGADIKAVGSFGFFVAHIATREEKPELLRYLLQQGADPNAVALSGDTPGHFAARKKNMECLRALYAAGATLQDHNMAGETPPNLAERQSNEEMMDWMKQRNIF